MSKLNAVGRRERSVLQCCGVAGGSPTIFSTGTGERSRWGDWLSAMITIQKDQRRRALRRKVSAPSVIRIEFKDGRGNSRHVTADLVDWSAEGMSLILVVPIDPGTVVQVRGKLGAEHRDISCQGTISWCHEADGRYRMGLEFVDTNEFEHFQHTLRDLNNQGRSD